VDIHAPSSLTAILDEAFESCNNLEFLTIPPSLETIGKEAFQGCSSLTSI